MPGLVVFITAAVLLDVAFCRPAQEIDVDTILEILQRQNDLYQRHGDQSSTSSSSSSSDDDSHHILRNRELVKLVQEASKRDRRKEGLEGFDDDTYRYRYKNSRDDQNHYNKYIVGNEDQDRNSFDARNQDDKKSLEQMLEELVSQNMMDKKSLAKQRKNKMLPSTLLDSLYSDKKDYSRNLNEYSKIFVVLNPRALEKSTNKNKLTELISRLVSASTSTLNEERSLLGSKQKYRGLPSNLLSRRYRRDSKELYAQKESAEDDFKPKRYRNERGGGGGGTGGRTAIPYIRHRGDIYERS